MGTCNGSPAQHWSQREDHLELSGSGKCMDVRDADPSDGAVVQLWDCDYGSEAPNQHWVIDILMMNSLFEFRRGVLQSMCTPFSVESLAAHTSPFCTLRRFNRDQASVTWVCSAP